MCFCESSNNVHLKSKNLFEWNWKIRNENVWVSSEAKNEMKWNWKEFWRMRKWKPTQSASALNTQIIRIVELFWPAVVRENLESIFFDTPPVPVYSSVFIWVLTVDWRLAIDLLKLALNYVSNHSTHYTCFNDTIGLVYEHMPQTSSYLHFSQTFFPFSFSNNRILLNGLFVLSIGSGQTQQI